MVAEQKKTRLTSGPVADRILQSIYDTLPIPRIIELKNGPLAFNQDGQLLDWYNLCYEHLDDYAELTHSSMAYYILGCTEPVIPELTDYDDEVISRLNSLDEPTLAQVKDFVYRYHPAISWAETEHTDPTVRLKDYLDSRKSPFSKRERNAAFLRPGYASEELKKEVLRIRRMSSLGRFGTDTFPELATGCGISIHWLLGVKKPIYCENEQAEALYDLFTLLPPAKQAFTMKYLRELMKGRG